ncbi:MAG: glycosyltransferase family 39 protein [Deltaproteobacteria bacterium]|nr:glycosyltransferase family 39 protein [Deltaproteobacteria bacterium]
MILTVAALLRFSLPSDTLVLEEDQRIFLTDAREILQGFPNPNDRSSVFVEYLAGLLYLGFDLDTIFFLQHVLGLIGVAAVFVVARRCLGTNIASIVTFAYGIDAAVIMIEHKVKSEALFVPFIAFGLYCALPVFLDRSPRRGTVFFRRGVGRRPIARVALARDLPSRAVFHAGAAPHSAP